jgi:flagellar motor switch protein FliM
VQPYNLGTQERIVRGRMPTMEIINARFARLFRIAFFNLIRRTADISVGQIRVQQYSEFIRNLPVPANFNVVQPKPLRGHALFIFDPNLIFLVVDNMFGGDGRFHTRVEGRDFTAIEQLIIHGLLNTIFAEYEKSWKSIYPITFEYIRSEMNTQFANIATPTEIVVVVTFNIEFSGATTEMHFCMPYSMIEPIRDVLYSALHSEQVSSDKRWTSTLQLQLQAAEVELVAPLGSCQIPLGRIMELKVGDIVPLNIHDQINATVSGVPVLAAHYGVKNGQYALKIDNFMVLEDI